MSTIRESGSTIQSGVTTGSSGGVARSGGPNITSGISGAAPVSASISLNPGDTFIINNVTYSYEGVITKSTGEAEIFLLSQNSVKCVFKLYYPNFKPKEDILKKLKQLKHEDIINVLDYGYYHDRFFEIMEYAEGGTLEKYLPIKDITRIKQIVSETVNAYRFCHENGIIHKDIKPQNIYYKNADGTDIIIGDFGISTILETGMSRHLTSQSLTVGYAAPEMYGIGGKAYVGREVDYYALGITIIHIWEGKSPFDGLGIHAISNLTTSGKVHIPDEMPEEITKLVKGLITVDYSKRWGYSEIERWLKGEDVPVHFQVTELSCPPYQFGTNEVAATAEDMAELLMKNPDRGKKQLYRKKISGWVNLFNQKLASALDTIVEDDYPDDQDAGIQKAIYLLDLDLGFISKGGKECRATNELADALEADKSHYIKELTSHNHAFYLFLETHDAKKEAATFRKYFSNFSPRKALNTIILELRGRDSFKLGNDFFATPEELLRHKDLQYIIRELKDSESGLSLWAEGPMYPETEQQVEKWRKLPLHDAVTVAYALEKGSPFTFMNGEKAFSEEDFIKNICSNIKNQEFMSYVSDDTRFGAEAEYWLKNYCASNYNAVITRIFKENIDRPEYLPLVSCFMKDGNENHYAAFIAPLVEKAYSESDFNRTLYIKHKLFLIKDLENLLFNKSVTDLNTLWAAKSETVDMERRTGFFMSLALQLVARNMKYVSKQELKRMKTIQPPEDDNPEEWLVFIDSLMRITSNTTIRNITNIHYANALQVFTSPVQTILPQPVLPNLYDEFDTPYRNLRRRIPDGLFCITLVDYQGLDSRMKAMQKKLEEEKKTEKIKRGLRTRRPCPPTLPVDRTIEDMVLVKGGSFQMGDTFGDGSDDEKPVHKVSVDDFYLCDHQVTQGEWKKIMGSNPSSFSSCGDDCPVENVSWEDVQEYIKKLNQKTGQNFRLPTEAEWEYAARSGGKKEQWSGTSNEAELRNYAWYAFNSDGHTHPVKTKSPNGLGLYDMSGNVGEWVSDWYGNDFYKSSPGSNPVGPSSGSRRVRRGGSWGNGQKYLRASFRSVNSPDSKDSSLGFRLARTR